MGGIDIYVGPVPEVIRNKNKTKQKRDPRNFLPCVQQQSSEQKKNVTLPRCQSRDGQKRWNTRNARYRTSSPPPTDCIPVSKSQPSAFMTVQSPPLAPIPPRPCADRSQKGLARLRHSKQHSQKHTCRPDKQFHPRTAKTRAASNQLFHEVSRNI